MSEYSAKNSYNSYCAIQRLTACLKDDIRGQEVHHIDENPKNNDINNLEPQEPIKHRQITNENRKMRKICETYITL